MTLVLSWLLPEQFKMEKIFLVLVASVLLNGIILKFNFGV